MYILNFIYTKSNKLSLNDVFIEWWAGPQGATASIVGHEPHACVTFKIFLNIFILTFVNV